VNLDSNLIQSSSSFRLVVLREQLAIKVDLKEERVEVSRRRRQSVIQMQALSI